MLLAARGDLDGAHGAARRAMAEHERVAMPFDTARTLLLLGQLERRQRKKESASVSLQRGARRFRAVTAFRSGPTGPAPNWPARTSDRTATGQLTPSEQRVAELAASGMKNRDVANALFISPKTVEANLARIYRKLGIKSRAELGRHVGRG